MHWYNRNGKPEYNATLKQARENNLLPSVTELIKMEANPGLDNYKINQSILGALTLPRKENESDYDFINRVREDGRQHAKRAAKLGNVIHKLIARYIMDRPLFYKGNLPEVWQIFETVKEWIGTNIVIGTVEIPLANSKIGTAGTCDFRGLLKDGRSCRIDWKTQNVKHPGYAKKDPNKKLKDKVYFYDSFCTQLVGYEAIDDIKTDVRINVVIGTNSDNYGIWTKYWNKDFEQEQLKKLFALRDIFYINKKLPRR